MVALALTPGCPAGIGPEIFPHAIIAAKLLPNTRLIWCASAGLLQKHAELSGVAHTRKGDVITLRTTGQNIAVECLVSDEDDLALKVKPGVVDKNALASQVSALRLSVDLALAQKVQGIVTGPIRKVALVNVEGVNFDGQTEFLHHYLAKDALPPLMCFAGAEFLLGLATIHVPIKNVAASITRDLLDAKIRRLREAAALYFGLGITNPKIVILGLNPHAGENGLIGDEEKNIISPLIHDLKREGFDIEGPLAADGFFGQVASSTAPLPHAVLAMYHDQGLGPYKLLSNGVGVNMTIGLKVARTSPAHGTADALAGQYIASPASLTRALEIAEKLSMV